MPKAFAIGLVTLAVACGGKAEDGCPAGYVCTQVAADGGAKTTRATGSDGGATSTTADAGPTTLTSEIQLTPTYLASDGTTLFWVSSQGAAPLSSMPVGGGAITTVVPAPVAGTFLAVDDVNVYYQAQSAELYRAAKAGGGTPALMSDASAIAESPTVLGTTLYWLEQEGSGPIGGTEVIKGTPLKGGTISEIGDFTGNGPGGNFALGVTSTTAFVSAFGTPFLSFVIGSGVSDGGTPVPMDGGAQGCSFMVSDTAAVYCGSNAGTIEVIASDGTTTTLGALLLNGLAAGTGGLAFDETYVYWVDAVTVGTIMRAPKAGGTAVVVARDTNPVAIAVDANAIYWSDVGGNIMRLPK